MTFSVRHPEAGRAAHYLTVVQGAILERAVLITAEPLILGRDASRPFYISDGNVSRSLRVPSAVLEHVLRMQRYEATEAR